MGGGVDTLVLRMTGMALDPALGDLVMVRGIFRDLPHPGGEITFGLFGAERPPEQMVAHPSEVLRIEGWEGHNYVNAGHVLASMLVQLDDSTIGFFEDLRSGKVPQAGPPSEAEIGAILAAFQRHGIEVLAGRPAARDGGPRRKAFVLRLGPRDFGVPAWRRAGRWRSGAPAPSLRRALVPSPDGASCGQGCGPQRSAAQHPLRHEQIWHPAEPSHGGVGRWELEPARDEEGQLQPQRHRRKGERG